MRASSGAVFGTDPWTRFGKRRSRYVSLRAPAMSRLRVMHRLPTGVLSPAAHSAEGLSESPVPQQRRIELVVTARATDLSRDNGGMYAKTAGQLDHVPLRQRRLSYPFPLIGRNQGAGGQIIRLSFFRVLRRSLEVIDESTRRLCIEMKGDMGQFVGRV